MSFLAPLIGPIASAIGGGAAAAAPYLSSGLGLAGSIFGGRGGQSGQQQQATDLVGGLTNQLASTANQYGPFAQGMLAQGQEGLGQAMDFWSPILSGSRNDATSVFAPDIARVNEQFEAIRQGTQGSRTGAGASIYAAAPYEKQAQIQSIFQQARPQAATEMGKLGQASGQLGGNTLQSMLTSLAYALGGGRDLMGQSNTSYDQSLEGGSVFMDALTGVLSPELFEKIGGLFGGSEGKSTKGIDVNGPAIPGPTVTTSRR